jgi:peptidoglycan/xylan/chitin deacetylase (PgdA/CDA1 family)
VGHNESLIQKKYRIDPENFKAQMQYLIDNKYTPITFLHLVEYLLYDKEIPEKPVVITFDDGLLNQYENAFPILKEFGFSATFFVYPGVTTHRGFMDWNQLKEIVDAGNEIGSHTIIHYNLTTVDNETLNHELTGSKKMLEDKLGITVSTLAYPNYAENETVRNAVQNAGYVGARAGWRSVKNSADEILHLKAQEVGNTKNPFVMPK